MKITIKIVILLLWAFTGQAQSKKDLRNNKVKSLTVMTQTTSGAAVKELIEKYNKQGEIIEESKFDKDGKLKEKTI